MPVRSDPQKATAKWLANLSNSTQAVTDGVMRVQTAPGQSAAKAADKWLQKVTAAKDKWRQRVQSVSLGDWQTAMTTYGVNRIGPGAQAKQGKMLAFQTDFLQHVAQGVAKVDAMPNVTLEDGINRAVAMIRHNANFKRSS